MSAPIPVWATYSNGVFNTVGVQWDVGIVDAGSYSYVGDDPSANPAIFYLWNNIGAIANKEEISQITIPVGDSSGDSAGKYFDLSTVVNNGGSIYENRYRVYIKIGSSAAPASGGYELLAVTCLANDSSSTIAENIRTALAGLDTGGVTEVTATRSGSTITVTNILKGAVSDLQSGQVGWFITSVQQQGVGTPVSDMTNVTITTKALDGSNNNGVADNTQAQVEIIFGIDESGVEKWVSWDGTQTVYNAPGTSAWKVVGGSNNTPVYNRAGQRCGGGATNVITGTVNNGTITDKYSFAKVGLRLYVKPDATAGQISWNTRISYQYT